MLSRVIAKTSRDVSETQSVISLTFLRISIDMDLSYSKHDGLLLADGSGKFYGWQNSIKTKDTCISDVG